MAFFSVIIPTLNEEEFLPQLLACLSKQTYKDFEVIVVDGKSSDTTVAKAEMYRAKLPQLTILSSDKRNAGHQRNSGAREATGTYIIFFDADVQIPSGYLYKIRQQLIKHRYMLLTTYVQADSHDEKDNILAAITNVTYEAAKLVERQLAMGLCIIMLRSLFEHIGGFDESVRVGEDHDLCIRCNEAGIRLIILKEPRLTMSFRRFRKYGYVKAAMLNLQMASFGYLRNPVRKALIDYPMGGHNFLHEKVNKRNVEKFEVWLWQQVKKLLNP